ncbi:hypothetical protein PLESTB_001377000 [Pleodorina starrii]|uniref:Uncharacterized protein n=1 Tax=Pleodorina starrii TaxID=330485 RepID=A0A9W6BVJ1_9CHLO|nr:hypothetical protein PLESTM_000408100 [Pleodorina starrii]GLC58582.1 hypothetical protein PLESTB_001377000 [Pleodorina starrii]GLC67511.1 hypothetical protein PLESTF_000565400 [Pleodorina starrii]
MVYPDLQDPNRWPFIDFSKEEDDDADNLDVRPTLLSILYANAHKAAALQAAAAAAAAAEERSRRRRDQFKFFRKIGGGVLACLGEITSCFKPSRNVVHPLPPSAIRVLPPASTNPRAPRPMAPVVDTTPEYDMLMHQQYLQRTWEANRRRGRN